MEKGVQAVWEAETIVRIPRLKLEQFVLKALATARVDKHQAQALTDNLIWCDLVGRTNHGVERLPILVERLQKGLINSPCLPQLGRVAKSLANLDGNNGFGHFVAAKATDHAIDIAKETGVGIVCVNNSNFFGAAGYYVNRAAERGMASIVLSNSFPKVAAAGGVTPVLGTNPFAFGAPRKSGRALIFDMSTASVAGSSIREKLKLGQVFSNPIAVDRMGNPISNPAEIGDSALLPMAGAKGFGLAIMVEVLSGVLSGAGIAAQVNSMYKNFDNSGANGHFILVIDIEKMMPLDTFYHRLEMMEDMILNDPSKNLRIPGMARWECFDDSITNGIPLAKSTIDALETLASQLTMDITF